MKIKKAFFKVLSLSCLLTLGIIKIPFFLSSAQAAEDHQGVIDRETVKERKKETESEQRRKQEELKKLIQHVVKVEIKEEAVTSQEALETLLNKLPSAILEIYQAIGGRIVMVDGDITKSVELKDVTEKQVKDSEGNTVFLNQYYVYAKKEKTPVLVIQASEDYGHQIEKDKNIYYEIGKMMVRDVLKPEMIESQAFIDVLKKIQADEDASHLLLSQELQQHKEEFTVNYIQEHPEEVQDVFARIFSYYIEPHSMEALKLYAADAFKYMETINWTELKEKITRNRFLEFSLANEATVWGEQQFKKWKLNQKEQKVLTEYTKYAGTFNKPLREANGDLERIPIETKKNIVTLDAALEKSKISNDIILYRGDDFSLFGKDVEKLIDTNGKISEEQFEIVKHKYKGKDRTEHGYLSTSIFNGTQFGGRPIITKFKVLQGSPGGYIDSISYFKGQYELLLPRNTTYIIKDMYIKKSEKTNGMDQIIIEALVKPTTQS
ncbi:hypothetical protein NLU03_14250 [Bacillus toyonensis]|nr:hypothetical protein [Bacillus toyonensis]MDT3495135.1 hypothetical protein [Bacillus toyonensis]MDT3495448.1 hypothetical protein [Bacillus toyonensis]MDT3495542.1 hypothetical protein [Bacillus toyonensis]